LSDGRVKKEKRGGKRGEEAISEELFAKERIGVKGRSPEKPGSEGSMRYPLKHQPTEKENKRRSGRLRDGKKGVVGKV